MALLTKLATLYFQYFCIIVNTFFRGDASTGSRRKAFKYLDDARVQVS